MDLLEYLSDQFYQPDSISAVKKFFGRFGLPIPQKQEYRGTADHGALVLLSDIACTIRITDDTRFPHTYHPRFLQPLISNHCSGLRIDVNPGVETPFHGAATERAPAVYRKLADEFERCALIYWDANPNNIARLPVPHNNYFLVIDPGCIKTPQSSKQDTTHVGGLYYPQSTIFSPLQTLFAKALSNGGPTVNGELLEAAKERCRQLKNTGALVANWESVNYQNTQEIAENYARRIALALN